MIAVTVQCKRSGHWLTIRVQAHNGQLRHTVGKDNHDI